MCVTEALKCVSILWKFDANKKKCLVGSAYFDDSRGRGRRLSQEMMETAAENIFLIDFMKQS